MYYLQTCSLHVSKMAVGVVINTHWICLYSIGQPIETLMFPRLKAKVHKLGNKNLGSIPDW